MSLSKCPSQKSRRGDKRGGRSIAQWGAQARTGRDASDNGEAHAGGVLYRGQARLTGEAADAERHEGEAGAEEGQERQPHESQPGQGHGPIGCPLHCMLPRHGKHRALVFHGAGNNCQLATGAANGRYHLQMAAAAVDRSLPTRAGDWRSRWVCCLRDGGSAWASAVKLCALDSYRSMVHGARS